MDLAPFWWTVKFRIYKYFIWPLTVDYYKHIKKGREKLHYHLYCQNESQVIGETIAWFMFIGLFVALLAQR